MNIKVLYMGLIIYVLSFKTAISMEATLNKNIIQSQHRTYWINLIQKFGTLYHEQQDKNILSIDGENEEVEDLLISSFNIIEDHKKKSVSISHLLALTLKKSFDVCGPLGKDFENIPIVEKPHPSENIPSHYLYFDAIKHKDHETFSALCLHEMNPFIKDLELSPSEKIEALILHQTDKQEYFNPFDLQKLIMMLGDIHALEEKIYYKKSSIFIPYAPSKINFPKRPL